MVKALCIIDGQSCSSTALVGMLGYVCVLLMVKAAEVLLSWDVRLPLCMLIVKAVVILLSWDVRLPLCIVDSQSCSSAALVGC